MVDDYRDFAYDADRLGKTPGQDMRVGEITLPMLYFLEAMSEEEKQSFRLSLTSSNKGKIVLPTCCVDKSIVDQVKAEVSQYVNKAIGALHTLPESPYKESLVNLTTYVMERGFHASS